MLQKDKIKLCPKCNSNHQKLGVYCSRHCANSRTHSVESKRKISESLTGRKTGPSPFRGIEVAERINRKCN